MRMTEWDGLKDAVWVDRFVKERITARCPGCARDIRVLAWSYHDGVHMFFEAHQCGYGLQDIPKEEESRIRTYLELQK